MLNLSISNEAVTHLASLVALAVKYQFYNIYINFSMKKQVRQEREDFQIC